MLQHRIGTISSSNTCTWCGKLTSHSHQQCLKREAIFCKCGKKGHYQAVCWSTKSVNLVTTEQRKVFSAAVQGYSHCDAGGNPWMVSISINDSKRLTLGQMSVSFQHHLQGKNWEDIPDDNKEILPSSQLPTS